MKDREQYEQSAPLKEENERPNITMMSERGRRLAAKSAPCSAFDTNISDVRDSLRKAASR